MNNTKNQDEKKQQLLKVIGKNVKHYRDKRGLTLRKAAEKADCSSSLIGYIENQTSFPSINTLYNIANALDVNVEALLSKKPMELGEVELDPIVFVENFQPFLETAKELYKLNQKDKIDIDYLEFLIEKVKKN